MRDFVPITLDRGATVQLPELLIVVLFGGVLWIWNRRGKIYRWWMDRRGRNSWLK